LWWAATPRGLGRWLWSLLQRSPLWSGYAISFSVHLVVILLLASLATRMEPKPVARSLTVSSADPNREPQPEILGLGREAADEPAPGHDSVVPNPNENALTPQDLASLTPDWVGEAPRLVLPVRPLPTAPDAPAATDDAQRPKSDSSTGGGEKPGTGRFVSGGGLEGRGHGLRAGLGQRGGTSPESEDAVTRGLGWLAAHQREDGSWRFDHREGPCQGLCRDPGTAGSTTAATGLALLAFLGAGEKPKAGKHGEAVSRGIYYLQNRLVLTPQGGDLQEGTMYAQGIAAMALSEAYAMTGDQTLQPHAQQAIDFICHAQHAGGGWRYAPGQPGDTTVLGWQLMALKSAQMAQLQVPRETIYLAEKFLDSVQKNDGAYYGYMKPDQAPTPTAVGLLMRMYLGWPREDDRLTRGTAYLEKMGPSRTDMYFNFYATQVLHHYRGPGWPKWNQTLRDRLVATQARRGHEHGSWYFADKHGQAGGRLYTTAMCVMILEVYYRYLPLYEQRTVAGGWAGQ
jgi:hypothetical protein